MSKSQAKSKLDQFEAEELIKSELGLQELPLRSSSELVIDQSSSQDKSKQPEEDHMLIFD